MLAEQSLVSIGKEEKEDCGFFLCRI